MAKMEMMIFVVERFQYILQAATSSATLLSEETLTYLNQGTYCTVYTSED